MGGTSTSTGLQGQFTSKATKEVGKFEYRRVRRPTFGGKPDFIVGDVVTLSGIRGKGSRARNNKRAEIVEIKGSSKTITQGVKGCKFVVKIIGTDAKPFEVRRIHMTLLEEL